MVARLGLLAGPVAFLVLGLMPAPQGLPPAGQWAAATGVLMAIWWLTEALPPAVTAMAPVVLLPLTGAMQADDITRPYASETNFLFLGGLIIATAVERWELHRRMALWIIDSFGTSPAGIVLGFMVATASISAWISNAATTMMMLPIATAVVAQLARVAPSLERELAPPLLLAVAHAATIGGLATIVGTPPNAIFVGSVARIFPEAPPIGFLQWMLVGTPVTLLLVPVTWLYLVRVASPLAKRTVVIDRTVVREQRSALGPMNAAERRVLAVFAATAFLWMFRSPIDIGAFAVPGWSQLLPAPSRIGDSTVAIAMALVLFLIPSGKKGQRLMDWPSAVKLPWGVLLLLGGGFALADATRATGLAQWIGGNLGGMEQVSALTKVLLVSLSITFLTEVMTNTALVSIMMPIMAASAAAAGTDPILLMLPCTLAASLGFMLPSGTAPNAIVFSTGHLSVGYMARVGFALNVISVIVVTAVTFLIARPVFSISLDGPPPWSLH
ncbi:MAG TPA: DASS family sodium-coupled anion symporter [Candidatus Limnocylindrales bacterium]|nr:DASS family sodium-coupled anion symporter [Candidatus Limnocylindrales bacterium]